MLEFYFSCSSGGFDQGLMWWINVNIDEVYIVYLKNNKDFIVLWVVIVSFYIKLGSVVIYDFLKYCFCFDMEFGIIGENIVINNFGVKVYFEGKFENECIGFYLFC